MQKRSMVEQVMGGVNNIWLSGISASAGPSIREVERSLYESNAEGGKEEGGAMELAGAGGSDSGMGSIQRKDGAQISVEKFIPFWLNTL